MFYNIFVLIIVLSGAFLFSGCERETSTEQSQTKALVEKDETKTVPLQLELPKAMISCIKVNLEGIPNLELDTKIPREPYLVPCGVENLAKNKQVTSSDLDPIIGTLDMIVDGDKGGTDESVVELGPLAQWIVIDLENKYELYAIVFWHFYKSPHVYHDVVVQVSNDPEFIKDVTTLFNNDIDNSLGLGVGQDKHYIEKAEGKLVDAKATKARYVKLWSHGNTRAKEYTHYIEVEVYGK